MDLKKRFELDPERLATTNAEGQRIYLYPEDARGIWKDRRQVFYWFLIIVYLVLPWIYIKGKPFLILNIFTREFTFAGYTLNGVEPILIFLVVASLLFFIAFVTTLFGRVWCGWACPQTVFIQTIFSQIETMIEGKARVRKVLDVGTWNLEKILKKSLKWLIFIVLSLHITHTFMGYFVGPRELFAMSLKNPTANMGLFLTMLISTSIILLDFGWFREQFCIIACPYGRMQSVMMDQNSQIIAYDKARGEPRRGTVPREQEGDCINCYACVKVCPTGIDIRRGTQLECIACTQCIDACDEIMDKLAKPQGLIKYTTENALLGIKHSKINIRSILYLSICLLFIVGFFAFLSKSTNLSFVFIRGADSPFRTLTASDGSEKILNHFTVKLSHQGDIKYALTFDTNDSELKNKIEIITPMKPLKIESPEVKTTMFFKFNPSILIKGSRIIKMNVINDDKIIAIQEVVLVGPTK
jgi:cytochrome c oxidase accessory protein FixG